MKEKVIQIKTLPVGLYIHIPFCDRICHYCDFAKTALFSTDDIENYFVLLKDHIKFWIKHYPYKFSSIYFGGGTPGIFSKEYFEIFEAFKKNIEPGAEITIEVNPLNITNDSLKNWKNIGFNRLSIGVQSSDKAALEFLTRDHTAKDSDERVQLAKAHFENINVDLIYGWKGQKKEKFKKDIEKFLDLGVPHLSLYCLTYAKDTPIGRRHYRGILKSLSDNVLAEFYNIACELVGKAGFLHEEVSNWAKEKYLSKHNYLYWQGDYYLGIGAGAHGFLPTTERIGCRYFYPDNLKEFFKLQKSSEFPFFKGINIDARTANDWLMEYIGCGLRCHRGIDLKLCEDISQKKFLYNARIRKAEHLKALRIENNRLYLAEAEWFRETAWSLEVINAFE